MELIQILSEEENLKESRNWHQLLAQSKAAEAEATVRELRALSRPGEGQAVPPTRGTELATGTGPAVPAVSQPLQCPSLPGPRSAAACCGKPGLLPAEPARTGATASAVG